ncbi:MAG: DNA repair protein RecO [Candidatus Omnitrophica bacterium]|nr:DNA repair protein RecO [Candidatus Omnitrophota bacterium]MDD5352521.1 DNA repair protein RecO [Candidatus Omnitrophota bacterium]MDD5550119.1 DNA repair protein RecO [Candidatus Omnitrophota bacterium]
MICRDEAIVLKTRDFRETSKIAVFYSKKFGKISGLLKGIRKDPKKFASRLDFLSINEIIFYRKRFSELHLVSQCDFKNEFGCLKSDVTKFGLAGFCAELVYSIMPPEDAHPEVYGLLLDFLHSLEDTRAPQKLIYNFTLKLLSLSGFQPHLESCVICRKSIKEKAFFSNRFGGLLCPECSHKDAQCEGIIAGTIATILFFQNSNWPESLRLDILPSVERQLSRVIFSFLDFHLEKKFKSVKMLNELLDRKVNIC